MDDKPLLIFFIGPPGSGKTYFGTRLAAKIAAVRLSSDATRIAMFGSSEKVEQIRRGRLQFMLQAPVFGAINYAAQQVLRANKSVILDSQATQRSVRRRHEKLAADCDAVPILVWIKTPTDLAINRGQARQARDDSIPYSEAKMRELMEIFSKNIDLPESTENLIEISGEQPFESQYSSFKAQLSTILSS